MKKFFKNLGFTLALVFSSFGLVACGDVPKPTLVGQKSFYVVNDEFFTDDLDLRIYTSKKKYEDIDITSEMIKQNPDMTTAGEKEVVIEYDGKKYTFKFTVVTISEYSFSGLSTDYEINSNFDLSNVKLKVKYSNDVIEEIIMTNDNLTTAPDMSTEGNKTAVFTYNGRTFNYNFTVSDSVRIMKAKIGNFLENYKKSENKGDISASASYNILTSFLGENDVILGTWFDESVEEDWFEENTWESDLYRLLVSSFVNSSSNLNNYEIVDAKNLVSQFDIVNTLAELEEKLSSMDLPKYIVQNVVFDQNDMFYVNKISDIIMYELYLEDTQAARFAIEEFSYKYFMKVQNLEEIDMEAFVSELYDLFMNYTQAESIVKNNVRAIYENIEEFSVENVKNAIIELGDVSFVYQYEFKQNEGEISRFPIGYKYASGYSKLTDADSISRKQNLYIYYANLIQNVADFYETRDFSALISDIKTNANNIIDIYEYLDTNEQYVSISEPYMSYYGYGVEPNAYQYNNYEFIYQVSEIVNMVLDSADKAYTNGILNYLKEDKLVEGLFNTYLGEMVGEALPNFDIEIVTKYVYELIENLEIADMEAFITEICGLFDIDPSDYIERWQNSQQLGLIEDIVTSEYVASGVEIIDEALVDVARYLDGTMSTKTFDVNTFVGKINTLFASCEEHLNSVDEYNYYAMMLVKVGKAFTDLDETPRENLIDLLAENKTKLKEQLHTYLLDILCIDRENQSAVLNLRLLVSEHVENILSSNFVTEDAVADLIEYVNNYCNEEIKVSCNSITSMLVVIYSQYSGIEVDYNELFEFVELPEGVASIDYNVLINKLFDENTYNNIITINDVEVRYVENAQGKIVKEILTLTIDVDYDIMVSKVQGSIEFSLEINF